MSPQELIAELEAALVADRGGGMPVPSATAYP
jgi:hypothetical protein